MGAAAAKLNGRFTHIALQHGGESGAGREHAFREVFRGFLPQRLEVAPGTVIDAFGAQSPQVDVIVYDGLHTPVLDRAGESVTVPMEGVYAVIEVASNLTRNKLREDAEKIRLVKGLRRSNRAVVGRGGITRTYDLHGREVHGFFPTLGFCFGFDGPSADATSRSLAQLDAGSEVHDRVDMAAVLNKGVVANGVHVAGQDIYTAWAATPRPETARFAIPIDPVDQPGHTLMLFYVLVTQVLLQAESRPFTLLPYFEEGYV